MPRLNKKTKPIALVSLLIVAAVVIYIILKSSSSTLLVSGEQFDKILQNQKFEQLAIRENYIVLTIDGASYKTPKYAVDLQNILSKYPVTIYSKKSDTLISVAILILLSILVILIVLLRKNRESNTVHSSSQLAKEPVGHSQEIKPESTESISFKSIAGIQDIKEDLEEIISFLKHPYRFKKYGIRMPKGVLLIGPPGSGKTLIAKAISSEASVPFFYHSGSSFVHIYAGMGAKRVQELFKKAQEMAPSIIFIDEIDSVGKSRNSLDNNERETTLNQLLVEMDGFSSSSGVIVIAATNRLDVLDSALLRPGRFDRRVFISLPNIDERAKIINLYLQNKRHMLKVGEVAKLTAGFSPAAIETLINEAAMHCLRRKKDAIDIDDIYTVKDRVIYGKKRVTILSDKEREIEADYQAVKATVATWLGFDFGKVKLSTPLMITQESQLISRSDLLNRAKVFIAGTLYLKHKYGESFNISIEDKKHLLELIETIDKNYTILEQRQTTALLEEIEADVESLLSTLSSVIITIAKEINSHEVVDRVDIQREIDALL